MMALLPQNIETAPEGPYFAVTAIILEVNLQICGPNARAFSFQLAH